MTATRIVSPDTAFSKVSTRTKRPREHNDAHLRFIRQLPCVCCGKRGVEAAHVRYGDARYGKPEGSMGMKPHDRWCVPLCPDHHREQHAENERAWWDSKGIDPLHVAAALWASTGDEEAGEMIINQVRRK